MGSWGNLCPKKSGGRRQQKPVGLASFCFSCWIDCGLPGSRFSRAEAVEHDLTADHGHEDTDDWNVI
jgi:hypothetical protein